MRRILALFLAVNIYGCAEIASYVEPSSESGRKVATLKGSCEKGAYRRLVIKKDLTTIVLSTEYSKDGGFDIETRLTHGWKSPKVQLASYRAILSTAPGYVLIDEVHATGRGAQYYKRPAGDRQEEIILRGTPLLDIDLADTDYVINYKIPAFDGLSTQLTLPSLLINGKNVDIEPITLTKKMSSFGVCYVPS